jgi:hypothetical protein
MGALMMEPVSFFETSVSIYQITECNIPEDSHLQEWRILHEWIAYVLKLFCSSLYSIGFVFIYYTFIIKSLLIITDTFHSC